MSTTLRLLGWKVQGLRCPDHEIDCCNSSATPARITLIQMPNGTGKTTSLTLLRAALSGAATDWDAQTVRSMSKKGNELGSGIFELALMENSKRITVLMTFDFESGDVQYRTTWGSGQEIGFNPPRSLTRFMKEDFVNFYVFDGELAENLLKQKQTHAEQAIESLFQVHLLEQMRRPIESYWKENTSSSTTKNQRGLTRRLNLLAKWERRKKTLVKLENKLRADLATVESRLATRKREYSQQIKKEEKLAGAIKNGEEHRDKLNAEVDNLTSGLLDDMRAPESLSSSFAEAMVALKSGMDRLKLPKSAAREFFEELAQEDDCLCGRPIDDDVRAAILERAQQYLGEDNVTLLNAIKSKISDAIGTDYQLPAKDLDRGMHEFATLMRKRDLALNTLQGLENEAAESDPEVKKAQQDIERLKDERDDLTDSLMVYSNDREERSKLDRIRSTDPDDLFSIRVVSEGIAILEQQVDEARETLNLREKRDTLLQILALAHSKASRAIAEEIRDEANDRIEQLMPHNDIRISEIDGCLRLHNQSGGSVGETLSVAYAFLSTLFHRSDQHQLPFVVDSPANPIDLAIRPKIGALVPKLTGQFVAFMISSERENFLAQLKKSGDGDTQFITLFRKGAADYEASASAHPSCVKTTDGYSVTDEGFFNEFQLDEENV